MFIIDYSILRYAKNELINSQISEVCLSSLFFANLFLQVFTKQADDGRRSLITSPEETEEEWERFENMEKKKEVQTLKNRIEDLKQENDHLTVRVFNYISIIFHVYDMI